MAIWQLGTRTPRIGEGTYVSESADVIGDVEIGKECFIGPGARLRGDYGRIVIGNGTSVEDNCVIHARPDEQTTIGNFVTLGHGCIIHNATIHDNAVIGMGSVVSDWAVVEEWGVVAESALVKSKQVVPTRSIAAGVPSKIIGMIDENYRQTWDKFKNIYVQLAKRYTNELRLIPSEEERNS
jgi:carbonic anhydrase/acetyltransferase-like protein (isoleucine patch superfamily)